MSARWDDLQLLMVELKAKFVLNRKKNKSVFQSIADWDKAEHIL